VTDLAGSVEDTTEKGGLSSLNTLIALFVSVIATFLAVCNVKDGNIVQAMAQAQANAVDAWAYYQAKSTKQHYAEGMVDQIEIQRDTLPGLTDESRGRLERKIAEYREKAKLYEREKESIKESAEGFQKEYDRLNFHDDQFDMAEASLSLAIALFGVTALTKKRWLLTVGIAFAAFGMALGLSGFLGYNLHPSFLAKLLS
jgi:hypothetical protein